MFACLNAFFFELNFPPSEKLSGVKFNTPNILGIFLKFKLEKFFFFFLFFLNQNLFFLNNLGKCLI